MKPISVRALRTPDAAQTPALELDQCTRKARPEPRFLTAHLTPLSCNSSTTITQAATAPKMVIDTPLMSAFYAPFYCLNFARAMMGWALTECTDYPDSSADFLGSMCPGGITGTANVQVA